TSQPVQSINTSDNLFHMKPSEENASNMVRDVADDEIKMALFDIDDSKALGLDGFTVAFFKKSWCIIRKHICCAIREFFIPGKLLGELNAILVSLIPKVPIPNKVTDFRPIACCNVLYRCISKEIMKGYNRKNGSHRVSFKIDTQKAYDTVNWSFLKMILEEFSFHRKMVQWIMQCVTLV
ncbi:hypothetical protein Tco_1216411, partial [Tanacetum coccineum]